MDFFTLLKRVSGPHKWHGIFMYPFTNNIPAVIVGMTKPPSQKLVKELVRDLMSVGFELHYIKANLRLTLVGPPDDVTTN